MKSIENAYDRIFKNCKTQQEVEDMYEMWTSPENLYEDGEISNAQANIKYKQITQAKNRALAKTK